MASDRLEQNAIEADAGREWYQALRELAASPDLGEEKLVIASALAQTFLGANVAATVREMASNCCIDLMVIRKTPIAWAPSHVAADQLTLINALALVGIAQIYGECIGFQEDGGQLVYDVMPAPKSDTEPQGARHRNSIDFHLDAEALGHAGPGVVPDGIALAGVCNDANGATEFIHLEDVLAYISQDALKQLGHPKYVVRMPAMLELSAERMAPIKCIEASDQIRVNCSPGSMLFCDDDGRRAALEFEEAIRLAAHCAVTLVIGMGDIVLWNQRRLFHARRAFHGRRHLQRVFITRNLDRLRTVSKRRNTRIFSARDILLGFVHEI
jgi:hypothetical protein